MCITLEPARLSSTILLAHEVEHEGRKVNVVGYQNNAESNGSGPNAMVLPIPSNVPMTQANCIDMTGAGKVFRDYEAFLRPRSRGFSKSLGIGPAAADGIRVFDSGSYTVLLTKQFDLERLRDVLADLPPDKRIDLDLPKAKIFSAFRKFYPGWHLAICIWNGSVDAEPILWWYEPMPPYVNNHFLPGLDAHDGNPPDPGLKSVPIDHAIVVGGGRYTGGGPNVDAIVHEAPEHLRKWLPDNVGGRLMHDQQAANGDWVVPKEGWDAMTIGLHLGKPRVRPPGYIPA